MLWCNFVLGANFIFLCLKLINIHYHMKCLYYTLSYITIPPKQRKIKLAPKTKLHHNIQSSKASMTSDKRMMGTPVVEHGKQRWWTVNANHRKDLLPTFFGFKEDEVEWRKASYTNRDATKVLTRGAPSPELCEVLRDQYF